MVSSAPVIQRDAANSTLYHIQTPSHSLWKLLGCAQVEDAIKHFQYLLHGLEFDIIWLCWCVLSHQQH
jgi:hypothetical protein